MVTTTGILLTRRVSFRSSAVCSSFTVSKMYEPSFNLCALLMEPVTVLLIVSDRTNGDTVFSDLEES